MKIALIVDKIGSAIHQLSLAIRDHNSHLDIEVCDFHPKRPDLDQAERAVKAIDAADIVHIGYWRSGEKLREYVDFSSKPRLLCHYNPYDAGNEVNDKYDFPNIVVVGNETIHDEVPYAHYVPYGIDLDFWKFNEKYDTDSKRVLMVVGRIEGKKGVLEVAKACKELEYDFVLVGRISNGEYFKAVMRANRKTEFLENVTNEVLREQYYKACVHVCNSVDGFESGTLPVLEAMACGCPVLTRNVGHIPELYNGGNLAVRVGKPDDVEVLKKDLADVVENHALRDRMRQQSWDTVKNRNDKRMAIQFEKLYYKVIRKKDDRPFVSIITPTKYNPEALIRSLAASVEQDYKFKEIVVIDSGDVSVEKIVDEFRRKSNVPIKFVRFEHNGEYTLAKARNLGVIEASGDLMIFCDDRVGMKKTAVSAFVGAWSPKTWLWGMKDDAKKGFVENFSCIRRSDLLKLGAFNERVAQYGGMTQELRRRFENAKIQFEYVHRAKAAGIARTKGKASRRDDIIKSKLQIWKMYN